MNRLHIPKWVCAGAIGLAAAALVIQAAIDIYQGTRSMPVYSPEWFTQAWQMALPTGFTLVFAAVGGCLINGRAYWWAGGLYLLVAGYMGITIANSMDFMVDNTVAQSEAQRAKATQAKDIAAIQNETLLQERREAVENTWRTYYAARTPSEKERALAQVQSVTKDAPTLIAPEVQVVKAGSGSVWSRVFGWRQEAIQEAKAVALPILIMIGKALGITLGFAFWPQGGRLPEPVKPVQTKVKFGLKVAKFSREEARSDIIRLSVTGALDTMNVTGADMARRWGVSQPTAGTWLREFGKEGIVLRERVGERNRLAVRAGKSKSVHSGDSMANGVAMPNGRVHA